VTSRGWCVCLQLLRKTFAHPGLSGLRDKRAAASQFVFLCWCVVVCVVVGCCCEPIIAAGGCSHGQAQDHSRGGVSGRVGVGVLRRGRRRSFWGGAAGVSADSTAVGGGTGEGGACGLPAVRFFGCGSQGAWSTEVVWQDGRGGVVATAQSLSVVRAEFFSLCG